MSHDVLELFDDRGVTIKARTSCPWGCKKSIAAFTPSPEGEVFQLAIAWEFAEPPTKDHWAVKKLIDKALEKSFEKEGN